MSKVEELVKTLKERYGDDLLIFEQRRWWVVKPRHYLGEKFKEIAELIKQDAYWDGLHKEWHIEKNDYEWISARRFKIKEKLLDKDFFEKKSACLKFVGREGCFLYFEITWDMIVKSGWSAQDVVKFLEKYVSVPFETKFWLEGLERSRQGVAEK